MKNRLLATLFALALSFPLAQAAEPTVAETVAAQVKADPAKAADIIAQAIADHPGEAAAIVKAAVQAQPGATQAIVLAAIKAVGKSGGAITEIVRTVAEIAQPGSSVRQQVAAAVVQAQGQNLLPAGMPAGEFVKLVANVPYVAPQPTQNEAAGAQQQQTQTPQHIPTIVIEPASPTTASPT